MTEIDRLIERFERWTGLDLDRGSSHSALERYLRLQLPANDPAALARYVDDLTTPHHPEALRLVDAITVCHTSFYRDPDQLAFITAVLRADLTRVANVWIPACATGEDPYSIALIAESLGRPVSILGTDINTRALGHATAGLYGPWSVRDLPPSMALPRRPDGRYEIPARLRRVVSFSRHNLMDVPPSVQGGWDVILCRNVLMYIARDRVPEVIQRLAASLRPGGFLFVGANDIFERAPASLKFVRMGSRHALWRSPEPTPGTPAPLPPAGLLVATNAPAPAPAPGSARRPTTPPPLRSSPTTGPLPAPGSAPTTGPLPALGSTATSGALPALGAVPGSGTSGTSGTSGSMPAYRPAPANGPVSSPPRSRAPTPTPVPAPMSAPSPSMRRPTIPPAFAAGAAPAAPAPAASSARALLKPSAGRAHAMLLDGDTSGALELVLEVLEADPLCVEARLIAGVAYQLAGDAQQATSALRAALVLSPDLWPAEMYLGFALLQLGEEASARRALRRGAQLATAADRLPLSPSVATWFEGWRVDAIQLGSSSGGRGPGGRGAGYRGG